MTAKDYLSRYRMIAASITLCREQQTFFRELATKITAGGGELPKSSEIADKVGKNAARIADIELEIQGKMSEYLSIYEEIHTTIARIPGMRHRQVIESVYINGHTLAETAEILGYSVNQAERYHLESLKIVGEMINNEKA